MGDGTLSPEELDALIKSSEAPSQPAAGQQAGASDQPATTGPSQPSAGAGITPLALNPQQMEALKILADTISSSGASVLNTLLEQTVVIRNLGVGPADPSAISQIFAGRHVVLKIEFYQGVSGNMFFMLPEKEAIIIADLMMGRGATNIPDEANETYLQAIAEAFNQLMGGVTTTISQKVSGVEVMYKPIQVEFKHSFDPSIFTEPCAQAVFSLSIGSLISESSIYAIFTATFVNSLSIALLPHMPSAPAQQPVTSQPPVQGIPTQTPPPGATVFPQQPVVAQPVQFSPLPSDSSNLPSESQTTLDLLMDVPLEITVELGRTTRLLKEILALGTGSIIELDKLAGEPVDLLVNGKLIAKGEVVVIDENFGVRITDIITPEERLKRLTKRG